VALIPLRSKSEKIIAMMVMEKSWDVAKEMKLMRILEEHFTQVVHLLSLQRTLISSTLMSCC
jgi:hypothetical protein